MIDIRIHAFTPIVTWLAKEDHSDGASGPGGDWPSGDVARAVLEDEIQQGLSIGATVKRAVIVEKRYGNEFLTHILFRLINKPAE